jgi:hypothetical protein
MLTLSGVIDYRFKMATATKPEVEVTFELYGIATRFQTLTDNFDYARL